MVVDLGTLEPIPPSLLSLLLPAGMQMFSCQQAYTGGLSTQRACLATGSSSLLLPSMICRISSGKGFQPEFFPRVLCPHLAFFSVSRLIHGVCVSTSIFPRLGLWDINKISSPQHSVHLQLPKNKKRNGDIA
uniref:Dolichyl-diphosphooligosaccharide--protein glycosyltransferase subunit KCP2 n=1 Tax=Spermophilus dauricus TaxID=99837 RepID=A0A8C9Q189_SPEDA